MWQTLLPYLGAVRDMIVPRGHYQGYSVADAHNMAGVAFLGSGSSMGTSSNAKIIKAYLKVVKACEELGQLLSASGLQTVPVPPLPALANAAANVAPAPVPLPAGAAGNPGLLLQPPPAAPAREVEEPPQPTFEKWLMIKASGLYKTAESWCIAYRRAMTAFLCFLACLAALAPKPFTRCVMRAWKATTAGVGSFTADVVTEVANEVLGEPTPAQAAVSSLIPPWVWMIAGVFVARRAQVM